jgi:hypothetical protein
MTISIIVNPACARIRLVASVSGSVISPLFLFTFFAVCIVIAAIAPPAAACRQQS